MYVIQPGMFRPDLAFVDQEELNKKLDLQSLVLSKIYSFAEGEDRNAALGVCKDWKLILRPQIDCLRLLGLMRAYRDEGEDSSELNGLIGDLEAELQKCDQLDRVFRDKWYSFAMRCSKEVQSIFQHEKLFEAHHFSKLFNSIYLLEEISEKNVIICKDSKFMLHVIEHCKLELMEVLTETDHFDEAVDIYFRLETKDRQLGNKLVRLGLRNKKYNSALDVAQDLGNLYRVLSSLILDLRADGEVGLALDYIQDNDKDTNAAGLLLVLSSPPTEQSDPVERLSDEDVGLIAHRLEKISFANTNDPQSPPVTKTDFMVFLVAELTKRGMMDEADFVSRILGSSPRGRKSSRFIRSASV